MLSRAFALLSEGFAAIGQHLVDTKFELGYVQTSAQDTTLILMDEAGTPDSSRLWDQKAHEQGQIVEYCKESFRQTLLQHMDRALLLDPQRLNERKRHAQQYPVPAEWLLEVGQRYQEIARRLTGQDSPPFDDVKSTLSESFSELGSLLET